MGKTYVIPLVAAGNRGKTQTLNLLAGLFAAKIGMTDFKEYSVSKLDDNPITIDKDNKYAFMVQSAEKKAIVVITTQGDFDFHIREAKEKFVDTYREKYPDTDLFWFLACRTSRGSWKQVEEYDIQMSDEKKRYWMYKGSLWTSDSDSSFKESLLDLHNEWNNQDAIRLMEVFNSIFRSA